MDGWERERERGREVQVCDRCTFEVAIAVDSNTLNAIELNSMTYKKRKVKGSLNVGCDALRQWPLLSSWVWALARFLLQVMGQFFLEGMDFGGSCDLGALNEYLCN